MTEHPHFDLSQPPAVDPTPEPAEKVMFTVRIIYRSGYVQDIVTSDFAIGKNSVRCADDARPVPLLLGLDDIAAVFQMDNFE